MVELYQEKGYTAEDAANLVEILTRNKETFINTMMVEGLYQHLEGALSSFLIALRAWNDAP